MAMPSATLCWKAGLPSFFSSSAFEMKAVSTSTAGIVAPTSTRNGACLMPRFCVPERAFNSSWIASASSLDSFRCALCARSQRMKSSDASRAPGRARRRGRGSRGLILLVGDLLRDLVRGFERQVVRFRALRARRAGRVRVNRQKKVRLLVVGQRGAVVQGDDAVGVARLEHARLEIASQSSRQPARNRQRGVFFEQPPRPDGSRLRAAVPGVDDDREGRHGSRRRGRGLLRRRRSGPPDLDDHAVGIGEGIGAREEVRIAELDRSRVAGEAHCGDEGVVVLSLGKRHDDP